MRVLLLLVAFWTFSCCSDIKIGKSIDINQNNDVSIYDIIDSVNVVQLETNVESLIHSLLKVIPYNNRYYILDNKQHSIFCFDNTGKFLFKIDKRGRGPQEYLYLADFTIDRHNNQILILVPFGDILYFDVDGRFLSRVKLPEEIKAYNEVYVIDNDNLLFTSLDKYQILYYSRSQNKVIKQLYPRCEIPRPFSAVGSLYSFRDSIYYYPPFSNKIMNITDQRHEVAFLWDFGEMNNTPSMIGELVGYLTKRDNQKQLDLDEIVGRDKYLNYLFLTNSESLRYRMAILEYEGDYLCVFLDKINGNNYVFRRTKEGVRLLFPNLYGESIIMYDQGEFKGRDFSYFSKDMLSASQIKIVNSYDPEKDNPFLIEYKLKR